MFCRQQSVADFPLLVKFFQRGSFGSIGDLTAFLDLVIVTNDLHLKHTEQLTKIMPHNSAIQLPPPPLTPYLQLEFRKSNRPR